MMRWQKSCLVFGLVASMTPLAAADWIQFRGDGGRSASGTGISNSWQDDDGVEWRAALPGRGPSGPIVVADRVFVSCSSGTNQDRLHVLCFNANTGEPLWHRQFWATGRTRCHPSSAVAAPTPASDGKSIFAFYSSNDLICLDLDGNLKWFRGLAYDFPKAGNDVGMSSSPVVSGNTVVVQVENQGDSFATAIDTTTGKTRWQVKRPADANWSSPLIAKDPQNNTIALLKSEQGLDAYDLESGKQLWRFEGAAGGIPSCAAYTSDILLPDEGLTRLAVPTAGQTPEVRWSSTRLKPGPASPIVTDDRVYVINRSGVLTCGDMADGKVQWQLRLKGTFWATPVLANDRLICINDAGVAQVVDLSGEKGQLIGSRDFGETVQGSPAVSDGALYVRSDESLWKVK